MQGQVFHNTICCNLQALYVFMALSLARDEFSWILRHHDNPSPKKANVKHIAEDFVDR